MGLSWGGDMMVATTRMKALNPSKRGLLMRQWLATRHRVRYREIDNSSPTKEQGLWSVILAGDHELATDWGLPKWPSFSACPGPYRMNGEEAFIQGAWKQAKLFSLPHRVLTVMDQVHWGYAWKLLIQEPLGRMVWQPENRGNLLSVFLPLSYIRFHDPGGVVIVWLVGEAGMLKESVPATVQLAVKRVQQAPGRLVGLAVSNGIEVGNGDWGCRGATHETRVDQSQTLIQLRDAGYRQNSTSPVTDWNEQIGSVGLLIANVKTLWAAGKRFFPTLLNRLEVLGPVLGTSREHQILRDLYRIMPVETLAANFFPLLGGQLDILALSDSAQQGMEALFPMAEREL